VWTVNRPNSSRYEGLLLEIIVLLNNGSQTDEEESDTVEGYLQVIKLVARIEPPVFIYNKLYCACWTLSSIESTISNQVADYLKVVFSSWKNLCNNMIITNSNPSYLELLAPKLLPPVNLKILFHVTQLNMKDVEKIRCIGVLVRLGGILETQLQLHNKIISPKEKRRMKN